MLLVPRGEGELGEVIRWVIYSLQLLTAKTVLPTLPQPTDQYCQTLLSKHSSVENVRYIVRKKRDFILNIKIIYVEFSYFVPDFQKGWLKQ